VRNLDQLNPMIASPRTFSSTTAFLPLMLGLLCLPLAFAAAPSVPFAGNYLAVVCAAQSALSLFLVALPRLFKWDWRTKYFGAPLLCVGSVSIVGLLPFLAIVTFGDFPAWARFSIFCAYLFTIVWWCRRFVTYYRGVFSNKELSGAIYEEDVDAIYYHQKIDKDLIDKSGHLVQTPSNISFLIFILLACSVIPFITKLSNSISIPTIHIFLTIFCLPIVLLCLGLAVRGFLIFYYYPWRLKRETGKNVYVVM
jgi:hypothetical protein